jgi:hypothetical protein
MAAFFIVIAMKEYVVCIRVIHDNVQRRDLENMEVNIRLT